MTGLFSSGASGLSVQVDPRRRVTRGLELRPAKPPPRPGMEVQTAGVAGTASGLEAHTKEPRLRLEALQPLDAVILVQQFFFLMRSKDDGPRAREVAIEEGA
jgi:hypothetical protein